MELKGQLDQDDKRIIEELKHVSSKIGTEFQAMPKGLVKDAAIQQYSDMSTIAGTIINLCDLPKTPSQPIGVLLRTIIESSISVFAFCKDPKANAKLYSNFPVILDWKRLLMRKKHFGCPIVPDDQERRNVLIKHEQEFRKRMLKLGQPYLKTKKHTLKEALQSGKNPNNMFRDRWYKETRHNILKDERMEWVYDLYYSMLCSIVHMDSAACRILSLVKKQTAVTLSNQFWGAIIYKLVETFRFRLPAVHKRIIRDFYQGLQGGNSNDQKQDEGNAQP